MKNFFIPSFLAVLFLVLFATCKKTNYNFVDGYPEIISDSTNITVDTSLKNINASKYAQARVFPGLVCATEKRITVTKTMELKYNVVAEDLQISVPPQPQFSTGLYAAPGELVFIDVPENLDALSYQIGAWTDNLSMILNAPRDPNIITREQLKPGRNYVRNLYGGHIYIYSGISLETPVNITFTNVVKSPDFIMGETDELAWKEEIKNSCVPWLELRSPNMIFVIPREFCVDKPFQKTYEQAMQDWNDIVLKDFYEWQGLSENPDNPIDRAPLLPYRVVWDIKPSVGYGHSGFPVVVQNNYDWYSGIENIEMIGGGGNWGLLHEVGHNNQQGRHWSWNTLGEVSNNLFAFKTAHRLETRTGGASWPPRKGIENTFRKAMVYAETQPINTIKDFDGTDNGINGPFERLTPFVQILDKVPANWGYAGQPDGWGVMTSLYKRARRAVRASVSDQNKRDFFYETVCEHTKKDWRVFFKQWGILVSNISLNKMSGLYPPMTQEIWKYDMATRKGGDTHADLYNRFYWTLISNSATKTDGTSGDVRNVFDGNETTFWESAATEPPFTITVNMGSPLSVKGFSAALNASGTTINKGVKSIIVEVSDDGEVWEPVDFVNEGSIPSTFDLAQNAGLQSFHLTSLITTKYFRYSIPAQYMVDGTTASLSEINVVKP